MSAQVEMRVGMSLYWVRLVRVGNTGWRATWKQHGVEREAFSRADAEDALTMAKQRANQLDVELGRVST